MNIKNIYLLSFFTFIFSTSKIFSATECSINYNQKAVYCQECAEEVELPKREAGFAHQLINIVTDSDSQLEQFRRLRLMDEFLQREKNKSECSNYKSIADNFKTNFKKNLMICQEPPDFFVDRKKLCEWVLQTYNKKIINSFYDRWRVVLPSGEVKFKKVENQK